MIIEKEIFAHGDKKLNFAAYPHSCFDAYAFGFDSHWHNEWEIIYVRDGKFHFYVDGRSFVLRKNEALVIDRYAIHTSANYEAGNGLGYNCFVFGEKFLCPDPESYIYHHYFKKLDSGSITLTQSITGAHKYEHEILNHLQHLDKLSYKPETNALSIQILLLSIFNILLQEQAFTSNTKKSNVQNELVKSALLYFNQKYHEPLQIADIAKSLNISIDHFIRLFKAAVGITPKQYIQYLRVQKALSIMKLSPDLLISDIAQRTGFDDVNYFSRVFKKSTGLSPSQYIKTLSDYPKSLES